MNNQKPKHQSKVLSQTPLFEGKWLGLKYTHYSIGDKTINNYQTVYRPTTKNSGRTIDGVQIIPIIKYKDANKQNQVILIANFRPSVGKFTLQFPSGLLQNDNYQQNGRREVLEETGYVIDRFVKLPYPPMYCDPWKSNQAGLFYLGIIDGDSPQHYKGQQLEEEENIIVHKMNLNQNFMDNIHKLAEQNNYAIESKVWSICIGLCLMKLLKQ